MLFFAVQMVTGMLLLMHYEPGITTSYASIQKLMNKVEFGAIMRSLHSWAANFMVASVLIHMFSAYFMKAYQKPRELTWFSGAVLLFLTITLGFTGYLLPWDNIAYFATQVGLKIAEATPWVENKTTESWFWPGKLISELLKGGVSLSNLTIQRFASIHYVILPWVFAAFMGFHVLLVQLHGNTIPKKIKENNIISYTLANKWCKDNHDLFFYNEINYSDCLKQDLIYPIEASLNAEEIYSNIFKPMFNCII